MISKTGQLKFTTIESKFGKKNDGSRNLNDYIRGGTLVPDLADNAKITSTSGAKNDFSDFRGADIQWFFNVRNLNPSDTSNWPLHCRNSGGSNLYVNGNWQRFYFKAGDVQYSNSAKIEMTNDPVDVQIRGDKVGEDDPYSSSKYSGVRNPGIEVRHVATGTVVLRSSVSMTSGDETWLSGRIPSVTRQTTLQGGFQIYHFADCYTGGGQRWYVNWPTTTRPWYLRVKNV